MSARTATARRLARRALLTAASVVLTATALLAVGPGDGGSRAATGGVTEVTPQTDASVPARAVTLIGASPQEAQGETWGVGQAQGASTVVRYTSATGWSLGPGLLDAEGKALSGFVLDAPEVSRSSSVSPLAGQMTEAGSGILAGTLPSEASGNGRQVVLVRNPGGAFQETAPLPATGELALKSGEALFGTRRAPLIAPLDEGGHAGALLVPVAERGSGVEKRVLHWNGTEWTSEAIEVPAKSAESFRVLAIGASSPSNAWLLAQLSSAYPAGSVALFHRHLGGREATSWRPVVPASGAQPGEPLTVPCSGCAGSGLSFSVGGTGSPPTTLNQILTVTSQGVWIDGVRTDVHASTTMFFKGEEEEGESYTGHVLGAWCLIPGGAPAGTPPCEHTLPEALPSGPSRSIAWSNGATGFGDRVITGLRDGVSLRLEGSTFVRVLARGGEVGSTFGAAFSSPREGWLGQVRLPVHLTLSPAASRLEPWPVSFRHALAAIAPQPGAAVGALSSEALAVGDEGEVARYKPGEGWLPESLLSPGGRLMTPRLRAVAWPRPGRAYAVGDLGEMWLWRGETNLWEQDPATPVNFRGNLLGIAFDPSNPARGYAVGEGGVLLSYGKSWTQEPESMVPAAARGASFTSIAFAGSQAVVAFRKLANPAVNAYTGGLLVNDGTGWRLDESAAVAMGSSVPWAVAGLPDGGVAFSAAGPSEGAEVFERDRSGAPWQQTPEPFPGGGEPGNLTLFRESGALRVIASGSRPNTYEVEHEPAPPPGFPPTLVAPYPLANDPERGVLRQTATGWSDEEHELNNAQEPPGNYSTYDTVSQPDPVAAVLISPEGGQGWAVGGFVSTKAASVLDTADIDRYPAEGAAPPGVASSPLGTSANAVTFAIGGGAGCAAPCADRAKAGIGPDVWLSTAMARAGQIAGVRAFLYTGPRVSTGETSGSATLAFPYQQEQVRYAELLAGSPLPAFAGPAPTDLDGAGSDGAFEVAFSGFPQPFGQASEPPGITAPEGPGQRCGFASSCQGLYYAFNSTGQAGTVRVIVLDDTGEVGQEQLSWLTRQLSNAKGAKLPAIVVGNADLPAQVAAGDGSATGVADVLVADGASAYFFDAPEENLRLSLRLGAKVIPAVGSGTLGYISYANEGHGDFLGTSGFLLAEVEAGEGNEAKVNVKLIPNIGELALDAEAGTLLRRSQAARFSALARRPRAGNRAQNGSTQATTDPYIPIPTNCIGARCETEGLFPEYTFTSSRPGVGNFVAPNLATADPNAVLLSAGGEPIADAKSGLFCAYNPGTTIVTITTGGLTSSLPVTVQAGSVRRPCGTQPAEEKPAQQVVAPPPPPTQSTPQTTPTSNPPVLSAPVPAAPAAPPLPAPPLAVHPAPPRPALPFILAPLPIQTVPVFVPPPLQAPANPTPPSGTSAVTSPVEAPEREEKEEEATESVGNSAVAYRAPEHEPASAYLLGLLGLAAFAGASIHRRPRRGRREIRVAPATISGMRARRRDETGSGARRP